MKHILISTISETETEHSAGCPSAPFLLGTSLPGKIRLLCSFSFRDKSAWEDEAPLDPAAGGPCRQRNEREGMGTGHLPALACSLPAKHSATLTPCRHFSFQCGIQTIAFWAPQTEL